MRFRRAFGARPSIGLALAIVVAWIIALASLDMAARAQPGPVISGSRLPFSRTAPVTFSADQVEYEREKNLVIAKGHVEAWQNGVVLHADEVDFNRQTGTATARGHVVLIEPDGQVLFADRAELDRGLRNGTFGQPRALLPQNGRFAAAGGERTGGEVNELAKAVYSTCNLCAKNPNAPPLWQIRAADAVDDEQHQRIEYTDATLQMFGVPVAYLPFFWNASPTAKRESGLLVPSFGINSHLGGFFAQPYYWVINDQSDATFTPMITTRELPELSLEYRRRFNAGFLDLNGSVGYLTNAPQGTVYLRGQYDINDNWRAGFNINRASSANYVTDYRLGSLLGGDPNVLPSNIYLEGFGEGAYSRFDTRFYQSLNEAIVSSELPLVLPRYQYSYVGLPDSLGGTLSVDTGAFNVLRDVGTDTRRAALTLNWQRPFIGSLGDLWSITLHGDAAAYEANQFNQQPNFGTHSNVDDARVYPAVAVDFRWPFMRDSGAWGIQLIEPKVELIASPVEGGSQTNKYPNEDSLDLFDFTTDNLFGFHRFGGIDRIEGGDRVNVALHGAWYIGGTAFDGLIGQSYQSIVQTWLPEQSGLRDQVSDIVGKATFTPTRWLDLTYKWALDHNTLASRYQEAVAALGEPKFQVTGGYIRTPFDAYYYYNQAPPPPANSPFFTPVDEVTLGVSTRWGPYRLAATARRDLARGKMVAAGADAIYENECFIADLKLFRRFTSYNGDNGDTTVLIQLTFKTIGQFGFRAL